jgi:hypothetical protein
MYYDLFTFPESWERLELEPPWRALQRLGQRYQNSLAAEWILQNVPDWDHLSPRQRDERLWDRRLQFHNALMGATL